MSHIFISRIFSVPISVSIILKKSCDKNLISRHGHAFKYMAALIAVDGEYASLDALTKAIPVTCCLGQQTASLLLPMPFVL